MRVQLQQPLGTHLVQVGSATHNAWVVSGKVGSGRDGIEIIVFNRVLRPLEHVEHALRDEEATEYVDRRYESWSHSKPLQKNNSILGLCSPSLLNRACTLGCYCCFTSSGHVMARNTDSFTQVYETSTLHPYDHTNAEHLFRVLFGSTTTVWFSFFFDSTTTTGRLLRLGQHHGYIPTENTRKMSWRVVVSKFLECSQIQNHLNSSKHQ